MKILNSIDAISRWSGKVVMLLIIPMILVTVYDVVLRYVFLSPTAWAYEISWMTYAAFFILGGAYTLVEDSHISVDIFFLKFSPKTQFFLNAIFLLVFLLPFVFVVLIYGIPWAWNSTLMMERAEHTLWRPYSFPVKWTLPIGFFLLGLQGIANLIRNLIYAIKGEGS